MRRYRARREGLEVPAPELPRSRGAAGDLAHRLLSAPARQDEVRRDELAAAQREVARLSSELAAQRAAARAATQDYEREQSQRRSAERDARFLALAFARTARATGIADRVASSIHSRVSPWVPDAENPWR